MPVQQASLANLTPNWTPKQASQAGIKGNKARWANRPAINPTSPEPPPDHSRQLSRINRMLARTDNPDRMNKLLDARAKLLRQAKVQPDQPEQPIRPRAKPLGVSKAP